MSNQAGWDPTSPIPSPGISPTVDVLRSISLQASSIFAYLANRFPALHSGCDARPILDRESGELTLDVRVCRFQGAKPNNEALGRKGGFQVSSSQPRRIFVGPTFSRSKFGCSRQGCRGPDPGTIRYGASTSTLRKSRAGIGFVSYLSVFIISWNVRPFASLCLVVIFSLVS